jgi:hypothetical protein
MLILLVPSGRVVVDVVSDPPLVVPYLDELVLVEAPPQPGDPRAPDPLVGQIRCVDVEDSPGGQALVGHLHQARREIRRRLEVEPAVQGHGLIDRLVPGTADAERDGDAGDPYHYALHRAGDRPRVGDIVPEVLPVVYPRDDDVGLEVHEAERDEPHAVDRRPRAGVAGHTVRHLALLHVERAPEGDTPAHPGAVLVGGHRDDVTDSLQGAPGRQEPGRLDSVVVGQYYAHSSKRSASPEIVVVQKGPDSITLAAYPPGTTPWNTRFPV